MSSRRRRRTRTFATCRASTRWSDWSVARIGMCDRVVVSTEPLANALSDMHHDIRVVPNMLATHLWGDLRSQRRTSKKPRVGWGGGTSHSR